VIQTARGSTPAASTINFKEKQLLKLFNSFGKLFIKTQIDDYINLGFYFKKWIAECFHATPPKSIKFWFRPTGSIAFLLWKTSEWDLQMQLD
jgi:hypothetical protein